MYNTDLPSRAELPSAGKLIRSTAVAALIAVALLITIVLPAEYGIDPTGLGRVMGLTQMGEIKMALSAEAKAGKSATVPQTPQPVVTAAPAATSGAANSPKPSEAPAKETTATQQHTMTVLLKPGQAAEIKLTMSKDARVFYEWTTQGGAVNYDAHGDPPNKPKGFYHGYGKGQNASRDCGTLQAAFDGAHGWFWRNRTGAEVTVTLKTSGGYTEIKRVL